MLLPLLFPLTPSASLRACHALAERGMLSYFSLVHPVILSKTQKETPAKTNTVSRGFKQ
jgi:hypothetical protein